MTDSELDNILSKLNSDDDIILTDQERERLLGLLDKFCKDVGILETDANISEDIHLN